jgi:hypothetical protein
MAGFCTSPLHYDAGSSLCLSTFFATRDWAEDDEIHGLLRTISGFESAAETWQVAVCKQRTSSGLVDALAAIENAEADLNRITGWFQMLHNSLFALNLQVVAAQEYDFGTAPFETLSVAGVAWTSQRPRQSEAPSPALTLSKAERIKQAQKAFDRSAKKLRRCLEGARQDFEAASLFDSAAKECEMSSHEVIPCLERRRA